MRGKIFSIQSLGTVDGPGIRYVIFLQGCNLRCGFCHNPESQDSSGGTEYTAEEIIEKATRFREYFGKDGGITASGGEPLLQAEFVKELFALAHREGINTCLDTAGNVSSKDLRPLLSVCDRVLLDIKYPTDEQYRKYTCGSLSRTLEFLSLCSEVGTPVTLRQVIVPGQNDTEESMKFLKMLKKQHNVVDKIELLPFKKLCVHKYDNMGRSFPFGNIPEPTKEDIIKLEKMLDT